MEDEVAAIVLVIAVGEPSSCIVGADRLSQEGVLDLWIMVEAHHNLEQLRLCQGQCK